MHILYCHNSPKADAWMRNLQERLPEADIRKWTPGDDGPADYAVVRQPPVELFRDRTDLKGIFSLSAGVDDVLDKLSANPGLLPDSVPLFRLEDAGMGIQMGEYAVCAALGWFRRFDVYFEQQRAREWKPLPTPSREAFVIGILGAGVLGVNILNFLKPWGFPLRCWSRSPKKVEGVESYYGQDQLPAFLAGMRMLISMLPDTPQTKGLVNRSVFRGMQKGAFFLNLGRGAHLVEEDLLAALDAGEIGGAMLDVFRTEPLPENHPFWAHPRIRITPHVAADTVPGPAFDAIASAIRTLETGEMPKGLVDRQRGY